MENDYHNPYDHHLGDPRMNGTRIPEGIAGVTDSGTDHLQNHYEAPSCLVRNPSGSLFIPSSGNFRQIILTILVRATHRLTWVKIDITFSYFTYYLLYS